MQSFLFSHWSGRESFPARLYLTIIMKKYSSNKDINKLVNTLIKRGWFVRDGKKHASIISPEGRKVIIPSTPSDWRAFYNFNRYVKNIGT